MSKCYTAPAIVNMINSGQGPATLEDFGATSGTMAEKHQAIAQQIAEVNGMMESSWKGDAAAAAYAGAGPLQQSSDVSAQHLSNAQNLYGEQSSSFSTLKNSLPDSMAASAPDSTFASDNLPIFSSRDEEIEEWNAQAELVTAKYGEYDEASQSNAGAFPQDYGTLALPPGGVDFAVTQPGSGGGVITGETPTVNGPGGGQGTDLSSVGTGPGAGTQSPTFNGPGGPGGTGNVPGGPGGPGGGTPGGPGSGSPGPGSPGYVAPIGTNPSGTNPSGNTGVKPNPGSNKNKPLPGYHPPGIDPITGMPYGRNGGRDGSTIGEKTAGERPGGSSAGDRVRGGGPNGSGYGRGGLGAGVGSGAGSGVGSGSGSAAGNASGANALGAGKGSGVGMAGSGGMGAGAPGAAGAAGARGGAGMGGAPMGGRGRGDDDTEHKRLEVLQEPDPDAVFGLDADQKTTPPVIGG